MERQNTLSHIFSTLLDYYGPQGWWPVFDNVDETTLNGKRPAYHPGVYDYPRNDAQRLEICVGAILTQNTSWTNVAEAITKLAASGFLTLEALSAAETSQLALVIKSAGYYNQKTQYLKNLVGFLRRHSFAELMKQPGGELRRKLLAVKGIGAETADCMLLYALGKPSFVVDAYTRRILDHLGLIPEKAGYEFIREMFESSMEPDLSIFQEYHALLVRHGKEAYRRKPYDQADPLLDRFRRE